MADPIVELESGLIRGVVEKHEEGFDYYAFKGIPYAEPPVGKLRFKDPLPVQKWEGLKECCNYGLKCLQHDTFSNIDSYSEDCLHLNVFTHSIDKPNANTPVMVVIHGGAFYCCSSDDFYYGPEYLIRKNIVLVTFNYRLAVLGFLNLEDEIAPGNQGLKDQIMALQWVQSNIQKFGGNPNNVTILGISVGGISAHFLSLSPLAKGLFHKVISHSGAIYDGWIKMPSPKTNAIKLCLLMGKELTDPKEIFDFLQSAEPKALQQAQEHLRLSENLLGFGPGVDDKSANPVIPVDPQTLKNQSIDLPLITGYNAQEGILLLLGISRKDFFDMCDKDFKLMLKLHANDVLYRYNITVDQVRRLYYQDEVVSDKNLDKFVEFASDIYFIEAIHRLARVQMDQSSAATYLYVYSYDTPDSISNSMLDNAPKGAGHFDEMPLLFKMRVLELFGIDYVKKGSRSYKMMDQLTTMWTNFAAYGKPTIETSELTPVHWLPINDSTVLRYLNLDDEITMQSTIHVDQKLSSAKNIKV